VTRPLIDPSAVAAQLVADYAEVAKTETAEGIVGLQSDNTDIAQSESSFYPLTAEQIAEGHITEERR
jgi:hypothetical protein